MLRVLTLLTLIVSFAASPATARQADEPRRIALVIGNSNYEAAPDLEQPVRDAEDVAAALDELGFDLIGGRAHADVTLNDILDLISAFTDEIGPDDEAVFYFSGHGIGGLQTNYILPSDDSELDDRSKLPRFAISTDDIVKNIPGQGAGTLVIILDACRDNPLPDDGKSAFLDRGLSKGVGVVPRGDFSLVYLYAAEPGERAYTGAGRNSYFTTALLQSMRTPGSELGIVIREVRNEVRRLTSGRNPQQRPWSEGVTNRPFYFLRPEELVCGGLYTRRGADRLWQTIQSSADPGRLRRFAETCSDLPYAPAGLEMADLLDAASGGDATSTSANAVIQRARQAAQTGRPVSERVFRECDDCPEMVALPTGAFVMGSTDGDDDEKPLRTVMIGQPFAAGRFEVTWDEWEACVEDGACDNAPVLADGGDNGWGHGSRPVIEVDWRDAQAYVSWLNERLALTEASGRYRLLSEAEWEYAARAVTSPTSPRTRFSWGDDDPICLQGARNGAVLGACDGRGTKPVGFSAPNGFGLHDMHGNVWEWVEDCYEDSYSGAPTDGSAPDTSDCSRRVLRGGSWSSIPYWLRSADRIRDSPTYRINNVGFRVARTLSPPSP